MITSAVFKQSAIRRPSSSTCVDQEAKLEREIADISHAHPHKFWEEDPPFKNFRAHPAGSPEHPIQVSGSSQPTPDSFGYLAGEKSVGIDVDLRQETHGYFVASCDGQSELQPPGNSDRASWIGVSYTNHGNWPNPGISSADLLGEEEKLFQGAEKQGKTDLVMPTIAKDEIPTHNQVMQVPKWAKKKVFVTRTGTEKSAVESLNKTRRAGGQEPMEYYRLPVSDELPPEPKDVDELVKIYRHALETGKNIHFHCEAGRGRTTTAMVFTRLMDGMDVQEALDYESNKNPILGGLGKDLREIKADELFEPVLVKATSLRLAMLYRFRDYWNSDARESMSFDSYMKSHVIDKDFMVKMTSYLKILQPKG